MRLAIDFAKSFATEGKRVAIMFPDRAESDRAIETHGADEPFTNIILRPLAGPAPGTTSSPVDIVMGLFGKQGGRNVNAVPDADMYICLVFSAQVSGAGSIYCEMLLSSNVTAYCHDSRLPMTSTYF